MRAPAQQSRLQVGLRRTRRDRPSADSRAGGYKDHADLAPAGVHARHRNRASATRNDGDARAAHTRCAGPVHAARDKGYFRSELGTGESGQSFARACQFSGVPTALIDFSAGTSSRQGARSIKAFSDSAPHPISLLCVNPDQLPAFSEHPQANRFYGAAYRIGAW
jgi:hypothetical protein